MMYEYERDATAVIYTKFRFDFKQKVVKSRKKKIVI